MFGRKHKHFSTTYQRQYVTEAGKDKLDCAVCQASHLADLSSRDRAKVIFSSSTCNGFYKAKQWTGTDGYHVDVEAVGGLTLPTGEEMWRNIYDELPINVDTHLVVGINDVLAIADMYGDVDFKTNLFLEKLESWYNASREHEIRHNLTTANRFSISKLLRPPQLYKLPGTTFQDSSRPGENAVFLKQNWTTQNSLIDNINKAIDRFNTAVRTANTEILGSAGKLPVVPGLHNLGTRTKKSGKMGHMMGCFREDAPWRKLHLVPQHQAKAVDKIVSYFKINTPRPSSRDLHYGPLMIPSPPQSSSSPPATLPPPPANHSSQPPTPPLSPPQCQRPPLPSAPLDVSASLSSPGDTAATPPTTAKNPPAAASSSQSANKQVPTYRMDDYKLMRRKLKIDNELMALRRHREEKEKREKEEKEKEKEEKKKRKKLRK